MNLSTIAFLTGINGALFFAVFLYLKKNKNKSDKILIAWLCLMATHLALYLIRLLDTDFKHHYLLGLDLALPLLYAPILYFYVGEQTKLAPFSLKRSWYHFLIFSFFVALSIPFIFSSPENKIDTYLNDAKEYEWFQYLKIIVIIISGIFYTTLSLSLIKKYQRSLLEIYSDVEKIDLNWLRLLTWGLGGIWLLAIYFNEDIIFSSVTVLIMAIAFFGLKQSNVQEMVSDNAVKFLEKEEEDDEDIQEGQKIQYAKSGLKPHEIEEVHERLTYLMKEKKLYKVGHLNLTHLAKELKIHPNYLSQVINLKEDKNFHSYINHLRVNEFIEVCHSLPLQKRNYLEIAYECGFNSKTTFNKYFKTVTGKTPTEFFV